MSLDPPAPPTHTFVVSDLHIADSEQPPATNPLWRRYKMRELFIDGTFARFLDHCRALSGGARAELILNGDIFDFDCVLASPPLPPAPGCPPVSWFERLRGLHPEQARSVWKLRRILDEHGPLIDALRAWADEGHDIVLLIGNHDLEMHWPAVQDLLRERLGLPRPEALRICEFYYISHEDTLITHGNQLDPYCLCHDPLHPFIEKRGRPRVRMPFGDLAGKYLSNGIGWFNPHVEASFVKSFGEWVVFFYRHVVRHQPFILWTWLWSSLAALVDSLGDGFRPALKEPLTLERRVVAAAERARSTPATWRALHELSAHPAVFRPWKVMRELWLDRALLLSLAVFGSVQLIGTLRLFSELSPWWVVGALMVLLPPVFFYAARVDSDVAEVSGIIRQRLPILARVAGVRRVVMGHTHGARFDRVAGIEYANTGHWAPGYVDMECTQRHGTRGFVWLRPDGAARRMELRSWEDPGSSPVPPTQVELRRAWSLRGLKLRLPRRPRLPMRLVP